MNTSPETRPAEELQAENQLLKERLFEAEDALEAIRLGKIDGLVVQGREGTQTLTLQGADHAYRVLVESMEEGAVTVAADGTIYYCNKRFAELLKLPSSRVIGKSIFEFLPDSAQDKFRQVLTLGVKGSTCRTEAILTAEDQSLVPAYLAINSVDIYEVPAVCILVMDLTEQKLREAELKAAKEAADAASSAKSAFLANMSHEIRTPLGAALGFAEILGDPALSPNERQEFVSSMKRNGHQLSRLIDDILDLSKVEAGRLDIELLEFSLPDLLIDVTTGLKPLALEKGIALHLTADGSVPRSLRSDPTRLRQILLNMVGNAIKFTSQGSVTVTVSFRRDTVPHALCFTVRDTGVGISPAGAERLFEPFMQADSSTTRRYGGTGLGLSLSRTLARALGGDVILSKSESGLGSTFVATINPGITQGNVRFDTYEQLVAAKLRLVTSEGREAINLNGVKVLLVEDAPDNQFLVSRILRTAGAEVFVADNGVEAIERVEEHPEIDVVLMDVQMPVLDGREATRRLRTMGFCKPIIALTAHAMKEDREQSLRDGFDDHLTKPVQRDDLLLRVAQFAECSGPERLALAR